MTTKRCPKCGQVKPTTEFSRSSRNRDGLDVHCKDCRRAHYEANREEICAKQRAYREAHREERNAYLRAYREANREELLEYARAYREANREELLEYARQRNALIGAPTHERWQEITSKYATRKRDPWSAAEDAYLAASTDRVVDDALALKRTYQSVASRLAHLRRRGVILARDQHKTLTT